ncbi:MAG: FAD/NAD(P)-binding protein [Nitrospirae bacterium]|nr:FAD/NAD(P)-binding protein [Nitrospirota bacterium]
MSKNKNSKNHKGIYLPMQVRVLDVIDLTSDTKLYRLEKPKGFFYNPGQFLMASVWGAGEVPISVTSTSELHDDIELCVRKVGAVTSAIHELKPGDYIGIRGPLGNGFHFEEAYGKDILFVAGGIGIAPLRSLINLVMNQKKKFGKTSLVYGSRNPAEVLFVPEIIKWKAEGMDAIVTVDVKNEECEYCTGIVTEHLARQKISFKTGHSYICGPHVMIKSVMRDLSLMGMPPDNIITTMEAHMKCGVGKCGHCYADGRYICTDGPVFSYKAIKKYNLNNNP